MVGDANLLLHYFLVYFEKFIVLFGLQKIGN